MRILSRCLGTAAVAVVLVVHPVAGAQTPVAFETSLGTVAPPGPRLSGPCELSVAPGTDAVAVLDAAVAAGCIGTYSGSSDPQFGFFVECIDGVCGTAATYWAFVVNDAPSPVGASAYAAAPGDEVEFSYQQWATCLTPAGCDPIPR